MSMELYVAFTGPMPSGPDLDRAMSERGLPFRLDDPTENLEGWGGYLPFSVGGRTSGVELDTFDGRETVTDALGTDAPPSADRLAAFRWDGELGEAAVALAAAAALASIVDGTIFDPSDGLSLSVDQAFGMAREAHDAA